MELHSFIFEITQNYIVILFQVIRSKHGRKISHFSTCKHKINESNVKVPTHSIACLYSKDISFYVFISDKFFNFFRKLFNAKTIEMNNFFYKIKQPNAYLRLHIHQGYYISPILYIYRQFVSRINPIKFKRISIIFLNVKIC